MLTDTDVITPIRSRVLRTPSSTEQDKLEKFNLQQDAVTSNTFKDNPSDPVSHRSYGYSKYIVTFNCHTKHIIMDSNTLFMVYISMQYSTP